MKNFIKWIGIIALIAVIGFSFTSCGDKGKDGNDGSSGGQSISGSTIVSGATVVYHSSIKNLAEAKSYTDFSYLDDEALSYYLDGSSSVTINSDKVTIKLGVPKAVYLEDFSSEIEKGITVSPSNAKAFIPAEAYFFFNTSDGKYMLLCAKDLHNMVFLIYADIDVTIKGTYTGDSYKEIWNVSFKKGWNYLIVSESGKTATFTSSVSQPSGYNWTVVDVNFFDEGL